MSAVFACRSGPRERPAPPFQPSPQPILPLGLTLGEARALLALAEAGGSALHFDSQLLRGQGQREAARRAVSRLRLLTQT